MKRKSFRYILPTALILITVTGVCSCSSRDVGIEGELDETINDQLQEEVTEPALPAPTDADIYGTLSEQEKRNLNIFLSNFSETYLPYYHAAEKHTAANSVHLINFVWAHFYLNLSHQIDCVTRDGVPYYRIPLSTLSDKLNRYFYGLNCTPALIDSTVNANTIGRAFSDGTYLWDETAAGARICTFSQVTGLSEDKDGRIKAQIDIYGPAFQDNEQEWDVPEWVYDPIQTWSESNKAGAVKEGAAVATLLRYEHLGKPSYQLVEYEMIAMQDFSH